MAPQHLQFAAFDFVLVFEQTARRRTRRMRSIFIERPTVARTHEQPRLLKPADRASEVSAVDREYLKCLAVNSPHPAWRLGRVPVPRFDDRIPVNGKSRLAFGKAIQCAERYPTLRRPPRES